MLLWIYKKKLFFIFFILSPSKFFFAVSPAPNQGLGTQLVLGISQMSYNTYSNKDYTRSTSIQNQIISQLGQEP